MLIKRLLGSGKQLAVCGECGRDTVVPVRWRTDDATHWWIRVRCGECGAVRERIVRDEDAHAFERRLHRTAQPIRRNLALLDRLGMQRDAELLAAALERDLIDAADFR
jgi:uncharacterized Zn finger protein